MVTRDNATRDARDESLLHMEHPSRIERCLLVGIHLDRVMSQHAMGWCDAMRGQTESHTGCTWCLHMYYV